jgi:hypothetical protein
MFVLLHQDILYRVCLTPCLAIKTTALRHHDCDKVGIRIYWSIGPISLNREEEYGHGSVLFRGWVASMKINLHVRDHVSCLVNIEVLVVCVDSKTVTLIIQMTTLVLELAYRELLYLQKPYLR